MKVLARGSLILLIASTASCASSEARIAKEQKRTDQTIAALGQMSDADSLAASGILSIDRDRSMDFLARATIAAPNRPDLLWLQAMRCAQFPACDPEPIERRLREIDPTNGAGWWAAMTRAGAMPDSDGAHAVFIAIGHSERVDIYWTTLIAHLSRAVANTKKMSLEESEVTVLGYLAAQVIPPYKTISTSCKGEHLQQAAVTDTCRGIAQALQKGDTYITEMIGVSIAKRVWPEDSPEWKAADEHRRVYDYRSKLYQKLEQRALTHPEEYLTLCAQNRRESDLFAAILTAAGYDPNPPAQ